MGHTRQVCICGDAGALLQKQKYEEERQHSGKGQEDSLGMRAAATDQDSAAAPGSALFKAKT